MEKLDIQNSISAYLKVLSIKLNKLNIKIDKEYKCDRKLKECTKTDTYNSDIRSSIDKILSRYINELNILLSIQSNFLHYTDLKEKLTKELDSMSNDELIGIGLQYYNDSDISDMKVMLPDIFRDVLIEETQDRLLYGVNKDLSCRLHDDDMILECSIKIKNKLKIIKKIIKVRNDVINNTYKLNESINGFHGEYCVSDNKLILDGLFCLYHELLHYISSYYDSEENIEYCGFRKTYLNKSINDINDIGLGLNEGFTQYLAEIKFYEYHKYVYKNEKKYVTKLVHIIGIDVLEKYYYDNNLEGLLNYIQIKYDFPKQKMEDFITYLDYMSYHNELESDKKNEQFIDIPYMDINEIKNRLDNILDELSFRVYESNMDSKVKMIKYKAI